MSEMVENRAEVSAMEKANEAEVPAGSVPRSLRNGAEPARGGDPLELETTGSRAAPLPVSLCERDIFPLPCCPTPRV